MNVFPTSDDSFARLHAAGWSVGEVRLLLVGALLWQVDGTNGENAILARALTQAGAWHRACQQAEAVGMLRRSQP
jgi:hypothetical protein